MTSSVNFVDSFPEGEAKESGKILAFPFGESRRATSRLLSPSGRVASDSEPREDKGRTDEIYFQ